MFNNIGGKIKGLAKVLFWLVIVVAVIVGLVFGEESDGISMVCAIAAVPVAFISSWFIYGFGELIDRVCEIAKNTRSSLNTPTVANNREYQEHIENSKKIATTFKSSGIMDVPKRNK